jgi:hypothetical protein
MLINSRFMKHRRNILFCLMLLNNIVSHIKDAYAVKANRSFSNQMSSTHFETCGAAILFSCAR